MTRAHATIALAALLGLGGLLAALVTAHATHVATAPATVPDDALIGLLHANGNDVARITGSLLTVADARPGDGVVVLPPGRALSSAEVDAVASHAARGGRVLVLGHAPVARALGVAVTAAPVETAEGEDVPATGRVREGPARVLALPDARPLTDAREGARGLAVTGNGTFVDADADGRMSAGDAIGPFTVVASDRPGRVVVVSSRELVTAEGLALAENHAFTASLVARTFPAGTRVLVDATGHADDALRAMGHGVAALPAVIAHVPLAGVPVAVLAFAAAGAVVAGVTSREHAREGEAR